MIGHAIVHIQPNKISLPCAQEGSEEAIGDFRCNCVIYTVDLEMFSDYDNRVTSPLLDKVVNCSLMTPRQLLQSKRLPKLTRTVETPSNDGRTKPVEKSPGVNQVMQSTCETAPLRVLL
jgi:hypothetical protein